MNNFRVVSADVQNLFTDQIIDQVEVEVLVNASEDEQLDALDIALKFLCAKLGLDPSDYILSY